MMEIKTLNNSAVYTASTVADSLTAEVNLSAIQTALDNDWSPWSGSNKCPKCNGDNIEVNNCIVLTTYPVQSQLRCKDCGHYFSSGMFTSRNTNEDTLDKMWQHDQSILGKPQVGDWPPSPQVGDPPWWPSEQEPPSYPDISIPKNGTPVGWICPKCGRCYAPHVSGCSHCNASGIKITY